MKRPRYVQVFTTRVTHQFSVLCSQVEFDEPMTSAVDGGDVMSAMREG